MSRHLRLFDAAARCGRVLPLVMLASLLLVSLPSPSAAQTLRGSRASVERMYRVARTKALHFYETHAGVRKAHAAGRFVALRSTRSLEVVGTVSHPVVLPRTRTVVEALATRYRAACGERLVVTSATRPRSAQPQNAHEKSVHPTGMAVDFRRPTGRCYTWLRRELLTLERQSVVEATEERRPPHFHVAVLEAARARPQATVASRAVTGTRYYTVKRGDTLDAIARRYGTTVTSLLRLNARSSSRIHPGDRLAVR